jgi:hypothetical protein
MRLQPLAFRRATAASLRVERQYPVWQHRLLTNAANTSVGGTVTGHDIIMVALLAFAVLAPPAFLWLGVMLERRRRR